MPIYNSLMSQPIFTISGLRGVVGKTLFDETVRKYAAAYGKFLGGGTLVIGRDTRPSSEAIAQSAEEGLKETGCQVVDLGVCPTPTVVHSVRTHQSQIKGGLMITASHNPLEWNGIKFVISPGRFLLPEEFESFRIFLGKADLPGAATPSSREPVAENRKPICPIENHLQAILMNPLFKDVKGNNLRIGIDAVNGAAAIIADKLLQEFGCEVVKINCTPERLKKEGFPHRPEPTAENTTELAELVKKEKLDAGFAYDPDGDRFSCIDNNGNPLGEEATICLACLFLLQFGAASQKPIVVVNLSTTQAVEDICHRFGAKVERAPVGEVWVVKRMLECGAILGGEGNGGVILPEINLTRDGLVASAIVLGLLSRTKKRLSEIRQEIPRYFIAKSTITLEHFNPESLIAGFSWRSIDQSDGLRMTGDGWWFHIRKSNTEPLIRVVCEAKDPAQAKLIIEKVGGRLRSLG